MRVSKLLKNSGAWALFGLFTFLLNLWAHQHPYFIESWYSRGLFQGIRIAFQWTFGLLPFPSFYLFWIGVLAFWAMMFWRRPHLGFLASIWRYWLPLLLGFAGLLFGWFFWLWGFNYARVPLPVQMGLSVQPLDTAEIWQALQSETKTLDSLRFSIKGGDTSALNDERFWPLNAEDTVRAAVEKWLSSEGFPVNGCVRGRFIHPEGLLFKFGASGIYWPFIGEGNLEAGLHPLRKLPAMAHEMSHGYGFSDEGICNFIAYAACSDHTNNYLAYCARLDYWNTLAAACLSSDTSRYNSQFRPVIPKGIVADKQAIRKQHLKFTELAPSIRYQVYDSYLKAQGIESGMLNYDEVLMLVQAWKKTAR